MAEERERRQVKRIEQLMRVRRHDIQAETSVLLSAWGKYQTDITDLVNSLGQQMTITEKSVKMDALGKMVDAAKRTLEEIEKRQAEDQILGDFIARQEQKEITK